MKLIFLHGSPASGKLTVAKALLRIVPGRLFDNHAAIDFARTMFDFGAPGFWELVHDVRLSALDAASHHGAALVVATYCYSEPQDRPKFEQFDAVMGRHGGELLPIFLHCSEDEIARRIGNADRAERRKITSMEGLNRFRAGYNDAPVPRTDCLMLDTTARPADATAREIVRHFGLGVD
jgi:chloramphenicol 3-O-phosphotransferase